MIDQTTRPCIHLEKRYSFMSILLGIDIGTSSVKALLYDVERDAVLGSAAQEYPIQRPQPGSAEQNPEDWWQATIFAVRRVLTNGGVREVDAISLSGQMHGGVLLDQAGLPLRPAIIWADQRSAGSVDLLLEEVGEETYIRTAGTLPAAGFMAATLRWLSQAEPDMLDQVKHVLLPKDYVRLRMTGEIATDASDAAGTGLVDIHAANPFRWSDRLTKAAQVNPDILPRILASPMVAGTLRDDAAQQLGLRKPAPVVAGCADQPAQAIGNGILKPGQASITVGSGGQVFVPLAASSGDELRTDRRLHVFHHAAPGWYALGATLSAGLSLRWLRDLLHMSAQEDAYATLSAEASSVAPGAEGLIFLPYLTGERTPHMDPLARGAFIGLSAYHDRGHLARAVMEGVSFALREALDIALELGGSAETLIASGGGMGSTLWRQMMADICQRPLRRPQHDEQAAFGAALLGGVGAGLLTAGDMDSAWSELYQRTARYSAPNEPNPKVSAFYQDRYAQFRGLYTRLRGDFHQLSQSSIEE